MTGAPHVHRQSTTLFQRPFIHYFYHVADGEGFNPRKGTAKSPQDGAVGIVQGWQG